MHVALAKARRGDFDKLRPLLHLGNGGAAAIAHAGAQAAGHLVDDGDDAAFVGHAAFNALGHELVGIGVASAAFLEVAVCTALAHGANGAHAAVAFVAAALVEDDFARRFFGASKHAAHHHAAGASSNGLGNVAAVADAAIGNQGHVRTLERSCHRINGHDLRHAHARHDARGADGTRANAHFHAVRARIHQGFGRSSGGDIAPDHLHLRIVLLDPAHAIKHAFAVAVRRVNHEHIHTGLDEQLHALFGASAHAHSRAHAQATRLIARGVGESGLLVDVFDENQALEFERIVHHQQAL